MSCWNSVEMQVSSCFLIFVCCFAKNLEQRKHSHGSVVDFVNLCKHEEPNFDDGLIDTDQLVLNTTMKG